MVFSGCRKNTGFSLSAIQGCYVSSWLIGTQPTEKQETHNATLQHAIKCLHLSSSFNLILKPSFQISHNIILPVTSSYFQLLAHMFSIGITVFSTSSSVLPHVFTPRHLPRPPRCSAATTRWLPGSCRGSRWRRAGDGPIIRAQNVRNRRWDITDTTDIPMNH